MKKNIPLIILLSMIYFLSCDKGEMPIPAHEAGEVITVQVEMGNDYRNQLFYNLETNTIIKQNLKTDWDLAFETDITGWHIVLNTSKAASTANTETTDFSSVTGTSGQNWKWDAHTGNLDSTAFGDFRGTNEVYVVDRGYDYNGTHTGYKKLVVLSVNDSSYNIKYSNLDGTDENIRLIKKDTSVNFVSFSFQTNEVIPIQPKRQNWHLLFTQYTHIFNGPPLIPYLVTGVLINPYFVEVATEKQKSFTDISYENISSYQFKKNINVIGYDWKEYNFNTSSYNVFSNYNYILKDNKGFYYKLRFTDFYNQNGDKGAPKMEIQKL